MNRTTIPVIVTALAGLFLIVMGCRGLAAQNDLVSASRLAQVPGPAVVELPAPINEPVTSPQAADIASGGLGLPQEVWEAAHDARNPNTVPGPLKNEDAYYVLFENGRLWYLDLQWNDPISYEEARTISRQFIPADARLVETYSRADQPGTTVDLYLSRSLGDKLSGEPGNFVVQYNTQPNGRVTRLVINTGINPR